MNTNQGRPDFVDTAPDDVARGVLRREVAPPCWQHLMVICRLQSPAESPAASNLEATKVVALSS